MDCTWDGISDGPSKSSRTPSLSSLLIGLSLLLALVLALVDLEPKINVLLDLVDLAVLVKTNVLLDLGVDVDVVLLDLALTDLESDEMAPSGLSSLLALAFADLEATVVVLLDLDAAAIVIGLVDLALVDLALVDLE